MKETKELKEQNSVNGKKEKSFKPGTLITGAVFVVMLALVVYFAVCRINGTVPKIFGYSVLTVVSPSMEPNIPVGSRILIKSTQQDEIKENDVITFYVNDPSSQINGKPNTHRVVNIKYSQNGEASFITKGDNNPVNDTAPVKYSQVIGKYINTLSFLTGLSWLLDSKLIYFLLILVPAALFFVFELRNVVKKAREPDEENDSVGKEDENGSRE